MMDVRAARLEMARVTCSLRAEMGGRLTRPVSNHQDRGGDGRGTRVPPRCRPTCSLVRRQRKTRLEAFLRAYLITFPPAGTTRDWNRLLYSLDYYYFNFFFHWVSLVEVQSECHGANTLPGRRTTRKDPRVDLDDIYDGKPVIMRASAR